jgi:hypothetical protein
MLKIIFSYVLLAGQNGTVLLLHNYLFVMLKIMFSNAFIGWTEWIALKPPIQAMVQARAPRVGLIRPTPCPPCIYPFWLTLWLVVQELQVVSRLVITTNVPSF